jgi:Fic family protein
MMHIMRRKYIYQDNNWPLFTWESDELLPLLGKVRNLKGLLIGKMDALGFDLKSEVLLSTLTLDVLKSTEF